MAAATDGVVIDNGAQRAPLTATPAEIKRMLEVIEKEILPVTTKGVKAGNKVFGASVLNKDLSTVIVANAISQIARRIIPDNGR